MLTEEVLSKYRSRRRDDLQACLQSLATKDFVTIERIGHKLKGNGVTFGYPELSKLGEELETSAQKSDVISLQHKIRILEDWVQNSEQATS